jgi:hypothetical protein
MRPVSVVITDELGQHRCQVLLVEDDDVVEPLSTKCPDYSFDDRVRTWRRAGIAMASTTIRRAR